MRLMRDQLTELSPAASITLVEEHSPGGAALLLTGGDGKGVDNRQ